MRLIKATATKKPAAEKKSTEEKKTYHKIKVFCNILLKHMPPIKNT